MIAVFTEIRIAKACSLAVHKLKERTMLVHSKA